MQPPKGCQRLTEVVRLKYRFAVYEKQEKTKENKKKQVLM
jgi:hypothetical protein